MGFHTIHFFDAERIEQNLAPNAAANKDAIYEIGYYYYCL